MTEQSNETRARNEQTETVLAKKNQVWENNHVVITKAMARLLRDNERWPTKVEIAEETGLSRPTVYKHLEDFGKEELVMDEMQDLKCMSSMIMAKLCELALEGDAKSMRMTFELLGLLKRSGGRVPVAAGV
jgi:hypothetical protein